MSRLYLLKTAVFTLLLFLLSTFNPTYSTEIGFEKNTLFIVSPSWRNFTEEDGRGFYFELIRMIYQPHGISIDFQITPWARSVAMVSQNKADALVGSYLESPDEFHYPKYAIWNDVSAAVFKLKNTKWQGLTSLHAKKVGWIRGYKYNNYIDIPMTIVELTNNEQAWKLLELNRIDFYIDSLTDLKLYMEENNIDSSKFSVENVLAKKMYLRFAKTDAGKRFANLFDQQIIRLQENGDLEKLYLKWGYKNYYKAIDH